MTRDGILTFLGGAIVIAITVSWIFLRRLKSGVRRWSSNKGLIFIFGGVGNGNTWKDWSVSLSASDRSVLKQRIAAPNEIVSDEELDLFLTLHRSWLTWVTICEISFFAILYYVGVIR